MPKLEWKNEGRVGKRIAFLNVEAGVVRADRRQPAPGAQTAGNTSEEKPARENGRSLELPDPEPDQDRVQTFKRLLSPLASGRLLDLGCGHGKFSLAAVELGWKVTAIDARTERWPTEKPGAENVEWVQSDVREYAFRAADFDVLCVLGLLYHLDQSAQMELLRRCSRALTIIDTHVGLKQEAVENGYRGEHYNEPGETEEQRRTTKLRASWGNDRSFWPTEESLIRMARDAGFSLVTPVRPPHRKNRTFYVCYP